MSTLSERVSSTENKHLLWSLLSEENIFAGLHDDAIPLIINIFETAINTTSNACTHMLVNRNDTNSLAELNKDVIQRVIADVSKYKAAASIVTQSASKQIQSSAASTTYKSADLHEARVKDITSKLKIHEDDMNSFLVLKKPAEINFADDALKEDRPIGDEMEQLIQAALATRARELEILQQPLPSHSSQQSSQSIQPQPDQNPHAPHKKNVSFASEQTNTNTNTNNDTTTVEMEIGTLFGKLKRSSQQQKQQQQQEQQALNNTNDSIDLFNNNIHTNTNTNTNTAMDTMNDIYKLLVSMRAEIQDLRDSVKRIAHQSSLSDSVASSE